MPMSEQGPSQSSDSYTVLKKSPSFPLQKKKSLPARGESRAAERQPEHTLAGRPTADGLDRGAAGAVVRSLGSEGPPTWDHIPAPPEERAAWPAQLHLSP